MTKLNFVGIALGVFLGLAMLAVREARCRGREARARRRSRRHRLRAGAALYVLRNVLSAIPTLGVVAGSAEQLVRAIVLQ